MVSQWPPAVPTWSNLVQFNFQQKHPDPAWNSTLYRGNSTKSAHMGWLSIKVPIQLKTLENSWEHWKTSKIIWYHPENNWGPVIDTLVQFEEDTFRSGPVQWGYLRPDQFLDHLTVITTFNSSRIFEIHPSTSMLKFVLTPWLLLPLFHLSQISIKSESNFQIFHSVKCFLRKGGQVSLTQLLN